MLRIFVKTEGMMSDVYDLRRLLLSDSQVRCQSSRCGLIFAESYKDAQNKLARMLGSARLIEEIIIWPWLDDDYFDKENPDVFDIY